MVERFLLSMERDGEMRIKLHNSLCKQCNRNFISFLFNGNVIVNMGIDHLWMFYLIDNTYAFIKFNIRTKKFEEEVGFGRNKKNSSEWFRNPIYQWKDI